MPRIIRLVLLLFNTHTHAKGVHRGIRYGGEGVNWLLLLHYMSLIHLHQVYCACSNSTYVMVVIFGWALPGTIMLASILQQLWSCFNLICRYWRCAKYFIWSRQKHCHIQKSILDSVLIRPCIIRIGTQLVGEEWIRQPKKHNVPYWILILCLFLMVGAILSGVVFRIWLRSRFIQRTKQSLCEDD